jgi:hypothetical protein
MNKSEDFLQIDLRNIRDLANSLEYQNYKDLMNNINNLGKEIWELKQDLESLLWKKRRKEVKEMISHLISSGYSFENIRIDGHQFQITKDGKIEEVIIEDVEHHYFPNHIQFDV